MVQHGVRSNLDIESLGGSDLAERAPTGPSSPELAHFGSLGPALSRTPLTARRTHPCTHHTRVNNDTQEA